MYIYGQLQLKQVCVVGGIAGGATTPLDVAKTRIMLEKKIHSQAECSRLRTSTMLISIYRENGIRGCVFTYFKSREIKLMSFYCISDQINKSVVWHSFINIFCMWDTGCDCLNDHCLSYTANYYGVLICNPVNIMMFQSLCWLYTTDTMDYSWRCCVLWCISSNSWILFQVWRNV